MSHILYWNHVALEVQRLDFTPDLPAPAGAEPPKPEQRGPTRTSRALAIVHAAMFNAQKATTPPGTGLYPGGVVYPAAPATAISGAAVAGAAVACLKMLWPRQVAYIESQMRVFMDRMVTSPAQATLARESADYGEALALKLLELRRGDHWDRPDENVYYNAPFHHQPDPMLTSQPRLSTHWGGLTPFLINGGVAGVNHALYLAPPPDWSGGIAAQRARYQAASADVQALGAAQSTTRTPEQKMLGIFWGYDGARDLGVPPRLYNQVVVRFIKHLQAARGMHFSELELARLFALLNMGMADAAIVAWGAKYAYDLWRPVVGIRQFDPGFGPSHGNGVAGGAVSAWCDAGWVPLGIPRTNSPGEFYRTPDFPAYPSGHATFGAVAFRTAALWAQGLGQPWLSIANDAGSAKAQPTLPELFQENFVFVSDEFNGKHRDPRGDVRPAYRRSLSLGGAIVENALSRVYLGVHWRFDGLGTVAPAGLEGTPVPADPAAGAALPPATEERLGGVPAGLQIADEISAELP